VTRKRALAIARKPTSVRKRATPKKLPRLLLDDDN
jgi:hypothetical protein